MSQLVDFMSYDEPRAILGVSDEELENDTLELPLYMRELSMDLEDLYPGLEQLYLSKTALPTKTNTEQKLLDVVQVYAAYATSKTLLTSLSLFAPKQITDGRATTDRTADPFSSVREGVNSTLEKMKTRVLAAVALVGGQVTVAPKVIRTYFGVAALATNPVTNT